MSSKIRLGVVHIYGNFRDKSTMEWAGTGRVDRWSNIYCSADCGEHVYDFIQWALYDSIKRALEDGETSGVIDGDDGNHFAWSWSDEWSSSE